MLTKMQIDLVVSIELISNITARKTALVKMFIKQMELECTNGMLSVENALLLTKTLSQKDKPIDSAEVIKIQDEKNKIAHEKAVHELAVEFLKAERKALNEKIENLTQQLERAEQRTDRFEQSLLRMTESVSHLANNRDMLMGQMLRQSSWKLQRVGAKEVLVLSDPIDYIEHKSH